MYYSIDLETMVQLLQEYKQTGLLHAQLPTGIAGIKELCHVEIDVVFGAMTSCRVVSDNGQKQLVGEEAVRELQRMGVVHWELTLKQDMVPPVRETSPITNIPSFHPVTTRTLSTSLVPRRLVFLNQGQMSSWPRMHRMVYALVDGKNDTNRIAKILSISPEALRQILRDLQGMTVISV